LARLDSGESNETFKVKGDENLIVRTSKEDSPDRIAHEKEVLKFLEQEGIENTPRLVYYSEETSVGQPIIVETFVGEEELNMEEASAEQIENLAEILAEIHSISVESYNEFFEIQKPISVSLKKELEKDFRNYSRKPYQDYISRG
jgi:aminoglycoside phosphotransferase (APT) family kinase protein